MIFLCARINFPQTVLLKKLSITWVLIQNFYSPWQDRDSVTKDKLWSKGHFSFHTLYSHSKTFWRKEVIHLFIFSASSVSWIEKRLQITYVKVEFLKSQRMWFFILLCATKLLSHNDYPNSLIHSIWNFSFIHILKHSFFDNLLLHLLLRYNLIHLYWDIIYIPYNSPI